MSHDRSLHTKPASLAMEIIVSNDLTGFLEAVLTIAHTV